MKKCLQFQQSGFDIGLSFPEFIVGLPRDKSDKAYPDQVSKDVSNTEFAQKFITWVGIQPDQTYHRYCDQNIYAY